MNLAAVAAVAVGVAAYYAVPAELVKVVWGTAAAAAVYVAIRVVIVSRGSQAGRDPRNEHPVVRS